MVIYYPSSGYYGYGILKVAVMKDKIMIYKKKDITRNKIPVKKDKKFDEYNLVYEIKKYKNIFIGKNSKKYESIDLNGYQRHTKAITGSYLLIHLKDLDYIYITDYVLKFKALEPIQDFYAYGAKLQNFPDNVHGFPFALTENYVYLFDNNKMLKRDFGDINPWSVFIDPKKKWNRKSYDYKVDYLTNID